MTEDFEAGLEPVKLKDEKENPYLVYAPLRVRESGRSLRVTIPSSLGKRMKLDKFQKVSFDPDENSEGVIIEGTDSFSGHEISVRKKSYEVTIPKRVADKLGLKHGENIRLVLDEVSGLVIMEKDGDLTNFKGR